LAKWRVLQNSARVVARRVQMKRTRRLEDDGLEIEVLDDYLKDEAKA
jgi:hypothetical protein